MNISNLHINFVPVHRDILNTDIIEFVGRGDVNEDSYIESCKSWLEHNGDGVRTFFTVSLGKIFSYAVMMFKYAKDNGIKNCYEHSGMIVLPAIFPTNKDLISKAS